MKKVLFVLVLASLLLAACSTPTPEPTKAPPTSAPVASTKAPEPTKAPAATTAPATSAPAATKAPEPTKAPAAATKAPEPTKAPAAGVTPKTGGTLTILVRALPNPIGNTLTNFAPGNTLYLFPAAEPLVGVAPDGQFVPNKLAVGWDVAPDGKAITFKLRQGVKFHDGTDFNAEAVKYNLDATRTARAELKVITSVDVVDTYTVKLNLSDWSNTILNQLSWHNGVMISPASVKGQTAEYIATHVVGTGPFMLKEFQAETKLVFTKNANYWEKGKPYLDGITYLLVADQNTSKNAFLSGQANAWDYLDAKNAPELVKQGYKINTTPGLGRIIYTDSINADSPFSKKEVRYAFEHAIDKQAIVDAFGYGTWKVAVGPCAETHLGCAVATANARKYDPAKAKQLLAQAGYPNGFKMSFYAVGSIENEMLTAIQAYLKDVGIQAEMSKPDSATGTTLHLEGWKNGVWLQGLTTDSPSYVAALQSDGPNRAKIFSSDVPAKYTELLAQAAAAKDAATQKATSEALIKYVQDEALFIPLFITSRTVVYTSKVHFDLDAYSVHSWNPGDAWLDP